MMHTMFLRSLCTIGRRTVLRNSQVLAVLQISPKYDVEQCVSYARYLCLQSQYPNIIIKRFKHKKQKSQKATEVESESDNSEDEEVMDEAHSDYPAGASTKTVEIRVSSLRVDNFAKAGFGTSRSKIEESFFDGDIRINGEKVMKKSVQVAIGDEVDLVLRAENDVLTVHRIVLLAAQATNNGFKVKIIKDKNLTIPQYDDPWSR